MFYYQIRVMINTEQLSIAGLHDIADFCRDIGQMPRRHLDPLRVVRFVVSTTSCFRTWRTARNRDTSLEARRQADGKVKICRGKEDEGLVSREARRLSRIRDDPQHYRERIESNWNRSIRRLLGSRTFLLGTGSLLSPSRSISSFFRFSRRLDISLARPLILERTKT